ncbi:MAG: LysE family translocator [Pseudomonadota bacterium]
MAFDTWLAYAIAATIIVIIPGPTILLVVAQSVRHGSRATVPLTLGVMCGDAVALVMSLLGLGAILATSAVLFTAVKWVGAAYLIYLGISMWRSPVQENSKNVTQQEPLPRRSRALFMHAFVVTTFNPKGIVFFMAFLPQFVNPAGDVVWQLVILGSTFVVIGTINAALYAVFAGALKKFLARESAQRWFNRGGGTALIGAGVFTAALERNA